MHRIGGSRIMPLTAACCFLTLLASHCTAAALKSIGAKRTAALPGAAYLLPRLLAHVGAAKSASVAFTKGVTTVAPGINAFLPATASPPGAGISSDGSLGSGAVSYSNGKYAIPASVGTQVGGNLFESFTQFNLLQSEVADFQGPASVDNIIARVTGGAASSIDGTIESDIQGANLFLINPAGVMFGPHATLNISGAFTVSTADYLKLADGGKFNASLGANVTLTSAPVSAFGFVNPAPAPVTFAGSQLTNGAGLNVIAGDVSLDSATGDTTSAGASLSAPSGGLTIFTAASTGEVPFNLATPGAGFPTSTVGALGVLSLSNGSALSIDGAGGGALVIQAGAVSVNASSIHSVNTGSLPGGNLTIQTGSLLIEAVGQIYTAAESSGPGGNLTIHAASLDIDGSATPTLPTGIGAQSSAGATGNAGDLNITVTGPLNIEGGEIEGDTFSAGNCGTVTIQAGSVDINGVATPDLDVGILAEPKAGSTGNGGDLNLTVAGALTIEGNGEITTTTFAQGNGGNLTIQAGSLNIDGSASPTHFTGIGANTDPGAAGHAGDLNLTVAGALNVVGGGEITAGTFSAGNGGDLTIQAGSLNIDGSATPTLFTGIATQSSPVATGNAGDLSITTAGALTIEGYGEISTTTYSSGNGGNLTVQAASLDINGSAAPAAFTGIATGSNLGATGNAGVLAITVAGALILDSGEISANTYSSGNGGDVTIKAGSLDVDGSATPDLITEIGSSSLSGATGNAGDLNITVAGALSLRSGEITADISSAGKGGNVTINAGSLYIDGSATPNLNSGIGAESNSGATGNAGDLTLDVTGAIKIVGGGEITATTFSSGDGGDLTIRAGSLDIEGGVNPNGATTGIFVEAGQGIAGDSGGNGGSLHIIVRGKFILLGACGVDTDTYSSGNAGDVTVSAGSILVDGQASNTFTAYISAQADGTGAGGKVTINAGSLLIRGGGNIDTDTHDNQDAGDVTIHAGSLSLIGDPNPNDDTYISSDTIGGGRAGDVTVVAQSILIDGKGLASDTSISAEAEQGATGAGGKVTINTGDLVIQGGGEIDTDTYDNQNAGNLTVHAASLSILGDPNFDTYISSDTNSGGRAGDVMVDAQSILIDGRGCDTFTYIAAEADGTGPGGKVTVNAGTLVIERGGDIDTNTYDSRNAGDLTVNVGSLSLIGDPNDLTSISSDTNGAGNAGNVTVDAGSILIDAKGYSTLTYISADANAGTGAGGKVTVSAGSLSLQGGGKIAATTFTTGDGGDIAVTVQDITISGLASGIFAGSALAASGGVAGGIVIQCDNLALDTGAIISTKAVSNNAGNITINVGSDLTLEGQSSITSSAGTSGGSITLNVSSLLYILDSSITATAGTLLSLNASSNGSLGNGGNITLDPEFIVLDDSLISANAAVGRGGNITLQSTYYLNSGSAITATGATAGTVTIASPELDLSGALVGLPSSPVGSETQLQETCAVAINGDVSSFIAVGQGDIEAAPDESQTAPGDAKRHDHQSAKSRHKEPVHSETNLF